jgi:predicted Rossmann fold nucleotide-binding protein DprA/Smf involved in DNA uptake
MTPLQRRILSALGKEPRRIEDLISELAAPAEDVRNALLDAYERGWVGGRVASLGAWWEITHAGRLAVAEQP